MATTVLDFLSEKSNQDILFAYCYRLTRSKSAAKDLNQDVNERIICNYQKGKVVEIGRGYMVRIAHSIFVDEKRKAAVKQRVVGEVAYLFGGDHVILPGLPELGESKSTIAELLTRSKYLSESEKAIMYLRCFTDKQFNEIANERGLVMCSLLSAAFRAVRKLRAEFEENKLSQADLTKALDGHDEVPVGIENINIELTSRGRQPKQKARSTSNAMVCTI